MVSCLNYLRKSNPKELSRALLLLLTLFPLTSRADVGSLGGVVATAGMIVATLWAFATLFVFFLLGRKWSLRKRLGWTALFCLSPVLLVGLALLAEIATGEGISDKKEVTREPMTVYGVLFPPGSQIEYDQTGGFFGWHANRTLQNIRSPRPVALGNIRIDGFIFIAGNSGNTVRVLVSAGQTIDGWSCGDTSVNIEQGKPVLVSCFLTAPRMWRGQLVPAGTFITADGDKE